MTPVHDPGPPRGSPSRGRPGWITRRGPFVRVKRHERRNVRTIENAFVRARAVALLRSKGTPPTRRMLASEPGIRQRPNVLHGEANHHDDRRCSNSPLVQGYTVRPSPAGTVF